jgi:hypothetical protein
MSTPRWTNKPDGSNWGRFGPDDQRGKMNLLTPERRVAAAREVKEGLAFTLSLPLDYPGGNAIFAHRKPPKLQYEQRAGGGYNFNFKFSHVCNEFCDVVCDDYVLLYLQYSTQWDGLCHVGQMFDADGDGVAEKVYYNGYRAGVEIVGPNEAETGFGAHALGIENFATAGVQGRGLLVDLHRIYGRKRAFVGYDDLMRALDGQKVGVEPGDFLCLYTGYGDLIMEMNKQPDVEKLHNSCAALDGRDTRLLQWITDTDLVAICSDSLAVEVFPARPSSGDSFPGLPLHNHCLFKQGVHLGELWYFTDLAQWLGAHNRWRFQLTAPPLRLPGAVGSPATPIATV